MEQGPSNQFPLWPLVENGPPGPIRRGQYLEKEANDGFHTKAFLSQGRRRKATKSDSLDPSTLKKTRVRRVLFNVGGITLFGSIFRVTFFGRSISRRVSVWLWTFVASVAGRNGRHVTGHV